METDEILTSGHGNKQNGEEGPGTISFSPTPMHGSATDTCKDPSKKKQARSVSLIILIQTLESFFLPVLGFCHSILHNLTDSQSQTSLFPIDWSQNEHSHFSSLSIYIVQYYQLINHVVRVMINSGNRGPMLLIQASQGSIQEHVHTFFLPL